METEETKKQMSKIKMSLNPMEVSKGTNMILREKGIFGWQFDCL